MGTQYNHIDGGISVKMKDQVDNLERIIQLANNEREHRGALSSIRCYLAKHQCVLGLYSGDGNADIFVNTSAWLYRKSGKQKVTIHRTMSYPDMVLWILENIDIIRQQYFEGEEVKSDGD